MKMKSPPGDGGLWFHRRLLRPRTRIDGYSLLEVVLVVGALGALSGVGYIAFSDVNEGASGTKIQGDVAALNEAVVVYLASGGNLTGVNSPDQVLAKLKTERAAADAATAATPITGSVIDRRLVAEMQTVREAATTQPRAYWNSSKKIFEVKNSGVVGIKRFRFDATLSDEDIVTEARGDEFYVYNANKGWVWDTDNGAGGIADSTASPGPSAVTRQPFPDAPVVTSPPVLHAAIVGEKITDLVADADAADDSTPVIGGGTKPSVDLAMATAGETLKQSTDMALAILESGSGGTTESSMTDLLERWQSGWLASLASGTAEPLTSTDSLELMAERLPKPAVSHPGGGYLQSELPLIVNVENLADYEGIGKVVYRIDWEEWQPYQGKILVNDGDRLSVRALPEDTAEYRDSYEATESYYAAVHIFDGVTEGKFSDVQGGPTLVYSLTENDSFLSHGRPVIVIGNAVIDGGEANTLKYMLSTFNGATAGVPFKIGELLYHNGTTYDGTHATSTVLDVDVVFTNPYAAKELDVPLDLVNTTNSDDADASADYVVLSEPDKVWPFELDGRLYDMTLEFGETDAAGFSTPTQFHAYEGETARVAVMATLTDRGPKPGGRQWGDWALALIKKWLTERGYL